MTVSPDTPEWLALRRVQRGGLARISGGGYLDRGFRIADFIGTALDQLIEAGLVVLGEPDPTGLQRASLTPVGHTRLAALNASRGIASGPR
ncbi:MAG: hypothetical protein ABR608_03200 [Pseudonocardiaceae bacterium]